MHITCTSDEITISFCLFCNQHIHSSNLAMSYTCCSLSAQNNLSLGYQFCCSSNIFLVHRYNPQNEPLRTSHRGVVDQVSYIEFVLLLLENLLVSIIGRSFQNPCDTAKLAPFPFESFFDYSLQHKIAIVVQHRCQTSRHIMLNFPSQSKLELIYLSPLIRCI